MSSLDSNGVRKPIVDIKLSPSKALAPLKNEGQGGCQSDGWPI